MNIWTEWYGGEDIKGGCEEWERWRRAYGEVVRRG